METASAAQPAPTRIIALLAFVRDEEGELRPAFEAREMPSEAAAQQQARLLAATQKYEGVIAWWRSADLVNGEFGEPVTLFEWGQIPEME